MIGNTGSENSPNSSALPPENVHRRELMSELAHPVRHRTLTSLDPDDGPTTLSALADRLADDETSSERLAVALHHCHLPKLADWGLVKYDRRNHLVSVTPRASRVESALDPSDESER